MPSTTQAYATRGIAAYHPLVRRRPSTRISVSPPSSTRATTAVLILTPGITFPPVGGVRGGGGCGGGGGGPPPPPPPPPPPVPPPPPPPGPNDPPLRAAAWTRLQSVSLSCFLLWQSQPAASAARIAMHQVNGHRILWETPLG